MVMPITLVCRSRPTLPCGVVRSRSAGHTEAVHYQLVQWDAQLGRDRVKTNAAHKAPSIPRLIPHALHNTNMPRDIRSPGHIYTNSVHCIHSLTPLCSLGQKTATRLTSLVCWNRLPLQWNRIK